MKIGIIGTGRIGSTLARKLKAAGHDIAVANSRGADGVKPFADEIGARAADARGAVIGAEAIILSIPLPAIAELPKNLFVKVPAGVPIIDTGNYYPGMRDTQIAEIDDGMAESIWVSRQIGRPVTKAFNNILAYSLAELGRPERAPDRLAVAVSGDDKAAKQIAMRLVNETGFDPVDSGSLEQSWRQQPSTPAYCCDYGAEEMRMALAQAEKGNAPRKRARLPEMLAKLGATPTHADIVALNRVVNSAG